jgi:hypothetical protein
MEAMLQVHRDPELGALLSRDHAEERSTVTTLLQRGRSTGQIAAWIMALIAALHPSAATDPSFSPISQCCGTGKLVGVRCGAAQGGASPAVLDVLG